MPKLYLHMGFPKTATTSLQLTCKRNATLLNELGLIYPLFSHLADVSNSYDNHYLPLIYSFLQDPRYLLADVDKHYLEKSAEDYDKQAINRNYLTYFKACLAQQKNILISTEEIAVASKENLLRLVEMFKDLFKRYDYDIVPILAVRSPYAAHCSGIQQGIKMGLNDGQLNTFVSLKAHILKLQEIFGDRLQLFAFNDICQHEYGPVGFLLEFMGVDTRKIIYYQENTSVSNEYVRAQMALNKKQPLLINNRPNPHFYEIKTDNGKHKFYLTQEEYANGIKAECEAENEFYRQNLGEAFCDKKIPFATLPTDEQILLACPDLAKLKTADK